MSSPPETLDEHLAGRVTTVCKCWRVTLENGTVLGYTDHDRPLSVDGTTFRPATGMTASEARATLGLAIDSTEIEGALSDEEITEEAIAAGDFDGATVEAFIVNWRSPGQFAKTGRSVIGRLTRRDGYFVAELESQASRLDRPSARFIVRKCDARLGDARCGLDLTVSGYGGTGTVSSIDGTGRAEVSGLDAFASRWFASGRLTWTSGAHAGRTVRVSGHERTGDRTIIEVRQESAELPPPGTTFAIVAGCDKEFATCRTKFSNTGNFRGFPHLPGNDAAYDHARDGAVFDGGPLVP